MKLFQRFPAACLFLLLSCTGMKDASKTLGSVERIDPSLDAIINTDARLEILGEGFKWSEGPVWIEKNKMLLFSDVPNNKVYKWTEEKGVELYLTPSGDTGEGPSASREPGANGLTLDNSGNLLLCQHGDRRIAKLDAPLDSPSPKFTTIADRFDGKRFSSPNDVVVRSNGDIFFTDPPYGLKELDNDSGKELKQNGVYKISAGGKVTLLVDSLTRPNGIAFFPGEKRLIVANSDPAKAIWYTYELNENDSIVSSKVFYDATSMVNDENKGLPDGLRISKSGNVFATGPGGIWIFSPDGKVLGKIRISEPTANCAFNADESVLYTTSNMYLCRLKLK